MVENIRKHKRQNIIAIVGAAHLEGMAFMLRQLGYKVEEISLTQERLEDVRNNIKTFYKSNNCISCFKC